MLQLVDAGAAAIVLPSLFEEEIVHEEIELNRSLEAGADQFAEALDYFPNIEPFAGVGDRYLARLRRIKAAAGVPVIASLNATHRGRLGPLRGAHAGGGRRRARAQPLPPGGRSRPDGRRHGGPGPASSSRRSATRSRSRWPSSSARTTRRWRASPARPSSAARTAWCSSTASTSRTSTSRRSRSCPGWSSAGRPSCACRCAGRRSSDRSWAPPCRWRRARGSTAGRTR